MTDIPITRQPTEPYGILGHIDSPADLRALPEESLDAVCDELRRFIIAHLSHNPGHFASSMGAVEIAVALHYVFDTPSDRLVWDVGHQAYAHKILTGRRDTFGSLRTLGGISGFPSPAESPYDTFTTGHAGNSISAALGMAIADRSTPGCEQRKTVAVIGDASISCGLAFEGLNNASNHPNNLLIILNDNDMSIDDNVGSLHRYLSDITTSAGYNRWRYKLYNLLKNRGLINDSKRGRLLRLNNALKAFISQSQNIFEGLNIRYFGPFDGHDVHKIVKVLNDIKDMDGPRILHLRTVKGKGFAEAEKDPTTWHAPGRFDPVTGSRQKKTGTAVPPKWQDVFGNTLVELADSDVKVVGITAAMSTGTSINMLQQKYPGRAFDTGISEGHAVTFAGGLASAGKRPFVAIYSSFLQRAYDNIVNDVAIQGLPVTFCIDRAGLVGEDGVTHHGTLDLAYMRVIPGMAVASPMDEATLRNLMYTSLHRAGPLAIRYPRGNAISLEWRTPMSVIPDGQSRLLEHHDDSAVSLLTLGSIGNDAAGALRQLDEEGIHADHYDMIWLKPLDEKAMSRIAARGLPVVTVEDGTVKGGLATAVNEWLNDHGHMLEVHPLGIPDRWIHHGTVGELKSICGYDKSAIADTIRAIARGSAAE